MLHIMTGYIDSTAALVTTIMVDFIHMMAVCSISIVTLRKTDEHITTTNSIIAIILSGGTNILDTPGHPRDREIVGNETLNNTP